MTRPIKRVALRWAGEGLRFDGGPEGVPPSVVDGDSKAGPSPMDHVLIGLGGCMGADVVSILEKSRVPVESMVMEVVGERAEKPPRKFERIRLVYRISGPSEEDQPKLQRAVDLSRDTYCSAIHSLRPDIEFEIEIVRE